MDFLGNLKKMFSPGSPQAEAKERAQIVMGPHDVNPPDNVQYAYDWLTGSGISDRTGGKVQPMSPEGASALLGNWMTETGDPTLTNLDIVEAGGTGPGRGISQYTAARRGPYDTARQAHIDAGGDPNSIDFQLGYFADEYTGKHDPAPGRSLVGYTRSLEELGGMDTEAATRHLRKDFFRPSIPHENKRVAHALDVYNRFN